MNWSGTPADDSGSPDNVLIATSVVSPCDAWAVGSYSDGGVVLGLILHWDGTTWARAASPNPTSDTVLTAIDAVSASDIWAVGSYGPIVAAGAPARAGASGRDTAARDTTGRTASTGNHTLVLHWNGTQWKQVPSPTPGTGGGLLGVTATSASNAWAAGTSFASGNEQTLMLHWNGTKWALVASPDPGGSSVGSYVIGTTTRALAVHCC